MLELSLTIRTVKRSFSQICWEERRGVPGEQEKSARSVVK